MIRSTKPVKKSSVEAEGLFRRGGYSDSSSGDFIESSFSQEEFSGDLILELGMIPAEKFTVRRHRRPHIS